jgi:predicted kinase
VAAEVAFLAMELDAAGRADLSRACIDASVTAADDAPLREVLPFYLCYRACVRGKVTAFQLDQPELTEAQRERARRDAADLFALAASYAEGPTRPALVLLGGLMGAGKTTLATALRDATGWALCSSDATRKALAGIAPGQPEAAAFGAGIYSAAWSERTYAALREHARAALAAGRSVVLDASFSRRDERRAAAILAREADAEMFFVQTVCSEEETLRRLAARWQARTTATEADDAHAPEASDGRPELYQRQRATWEPYDATAEPETRHLTISTEQPPTQALARLLDALRVPTRACWLAG